MTRWLFCLCLLAVAVVPATARSDDQAAAEEFFEKRVRPVLAERCFECHSGETVESELRIDSLAGVLKGGSRGPAVIPGDAEKSLLILAVNHSDQVNMPPRSKIPQREIDDLTEWVKQGAQWPGEKAPAPGTAAQGRREVTDDDRNFWAFRPVERPRIPPSTDDSWPRSSIDRFIAQSLGEKGFHPVAEADRRTLIRRVTYDLLGLPPTPEEVASFVADDSPDAFERLVDRLLSSPHYGIRWGRHWLDIARYGDSNGLDENLAFANAWRYRDYVVDAFNSDLPYSEFLKEQIAGDLMPSDDPAVRFRRLTATGLLVIGAKMLAEDDPVKMEMDIIDEQVDTLGKAVLGLTLGCARCHDHKYDPLPMADYYSLAGIFKSTKTMENFSVVAKWQERPLAMPDEIARRDAIAARAADVQKQVDGLINDERSRLSDEVRSRTADYLLAVYRDRAVKSLVPAASAESGKEDAGGRLIEADQYDRGNVIRDVDNYGKGIGVLVNRGETPNFAEFDVEWPAEGLFQVDIRYAAADARPCQFSINGQVVRADVAGGTTGGWTPEFQEWEVVGVYRLPAGKTVLRLEQSGAFPHIDKLLLTPATGEAALAGQTFDESLIPEVTKRWDHVLSGDSPEFDAWRHFIEHKSWSGYASAANPLAGDLLAEPRPATVAELATRYATVLSAQAASGDPETPAVVTLKSESGPWALDAIPEASFSAAARDQLTSLRSRKEDVDKTIPAFAEVMSAAEGTPQNLRIHLRGSHVSLGDESARGFLEVLDRGHDPQISTSSSGRLELAEWLTSRHNPLVSRVIVNRVWQHHFGEGLVRSPDNFGKLGETPSHPELLDWLAAELMDSGWSLKHLHRLILTSSTWRQGSDWNAEAAGVDPENRLLWRMSRQRLDAEAIRDTLLAVGGGLDNTLGGTLLATKNRAYVTSTANVDPQMYVTGRRTIYLPVVRSALFNFLDAFDFGDPSVMQGKRPVTTVAPQALFLMNSAIVAEQADRVASRIRESAMSDEQSIQRAFELLLSRTAREDEIELSRHFLDRERESQMSAGGENSEIEQRVWKAFCRSLMAANEFLFLN